MLDVTLCLIDDIFLANANLGEGLSGPFKVKVAAVSLAMKACKKYASCKGNGGLGGHLLFCTSEVPVYDTFDDDDGKRS